LRATLRTGPHCIGPKTTFEALNSRKPSFFSRWSIWIVRVTDWNPWSEMNRTRSSGRVRETNEPIASSSCA
jgi:hypothetical protein